jgi:hypothetical protein
MLQILIQGIQSDIEAKDKWEYIWNSDEYSSRKGYLQINGVNDASPIFRWKWKSCVMGKHKFLFWLLLRDHNTRELLKRKNMELDDYNCILCIHNAEERLMQLFFKCAFSKWCWHFVKVQWNTSLPPNVMLIRSQRQFNSKIFREVIMIARWMIWCHLWWSNNISSLMEKSV